VKPVRVLGLSGNVKAPSRTSALVAAILRAVARETGAEVEHVDLAVEAPLVMRALRSDQLDEAGRALIGRIETADALVVGSPVYRASYTGALKHVFDLVDFRALTGKPVILAATGGSPLHGLMPDHQLRPLFAFFKALSLPTAIYALESDFEDYAVASSAVEARIGAAAGELARLLGPSLGERGQTWWASGRPPLKAMQ
jgi:FMN reductase